MRASFTVLLVVATIAVGGCSQTTTPSSPSSVVADTAASTSTSETTMAQGGKPGAAATTVLLVCDSAVNAQVDVRLVDDILTQNLLGTAHLECGPDSLLGSRRDTVKVTTFAQAGWAIVDLFAVRTGAFNGGCPGATVLPASLECPGSSKKAPAAGATLTFK